MLKQSFLSISIVCSVLCAPRHLRAVKGRIESLVLSRKSLRRTLIEAANNGDIAVVKRVIAGNENAGGGVDLVNAQDDEGYTSLMYAAFKGHKNIVHYLLDHGADPNIENDKGQTALVYAASNGHNKIVSVLIRKSKRCIEICDSKGMSALIVAICRDQEPVVRKLVCADRSIIKKTKFRLSPLFLAVGRASSKLIELLLDNGASVNEVTDCNDSPLMLAAKENREAVTRLLISRGAMLEAKNNAGDTALLFAASNGSEDVCRVLIEAGANVKVCNKLADTPLHCAAVTGNVAIMKMLLNQGALVNAPNVLGITPLMSALDAKSLDAVRLLLTAGADAHAQMVEEMDGDVLGVALNRSTFPCLQLLLDTYQFDFEKVDCEGNSFLLQAIKVGNRDGVAALLGRGALPNVRNKAGEVPLTLAVRRKKMGIVYTLLRHKKVDKNIQNGRGQTPLMLSALTKNKELCTYLLDAGASVDRVDAKGRTALEYALAVRDSDIAKALLKRMEPPFPIDALHNIGIELTSEQMRAQMFSNAAVEPGEKS